MAIPKVLCVDDEELLLKSLKRVLSKEPYEILTASNGSEALQILADNEIAVIVADQKMPGMTGTELLAKVKQLSKKTVRVILSGYADLEVMMDSINRGHVYMYMKKPWTDERLRAQIRQCLLHYEKSKVDDSLLEKLEIQQTKINKTQKWMAEKHGQLGPNIQLLIQGLQILPLPIMFIDPESKVFFINDELAALFPSLDGVSTPVQMEKVLISDLTEAVDKLLLSSASEMEVLSYPGVVKIQKITFGEFFAGFLLSFHESRIGE